jgi:tRNA (cytidine/uridine-2'-O-)-methyltransferase
MLSLNVVLFEPEIPQNTGNIVRTCAAVGATLHLIEPLGFSMEDRYLKRAGLDYWRMVKLVNYQNISEFLTNNLGENINFITKKAGKTYDQIDYSGHVFLVFGRETEGLPEFVLDKHWDHCFRMPMVSAARSLNLSNAVAVVVYEALRQNRFTGLQVRGDLKSTKKTGYANDKP